MAIFAAADTYTARVARRDEIELLDRALARWSGYRLPNGIPKRKHLVPTMFNADQLAIGTKIELEHTREPATALEIAMAHLSEHPLYYAALEATERRLQHYPR